MPNCSWPLDLACPNPGTIPICAFLLCDAHYAAWHTTMQRLMDRARIIGPAIRLAAYRP